MAFKIDGIVERLCIGVPKTNCALMRNWAHKDMHVDYAAFKKRSPWLRLIPDELSTKLLEASYTFSVDEASLVYDMDQHLSGLYGLVSGVVAIRTDNPQTEAVCAHLMGPGAWMGEISIMIRSKSVIGVEARTPCKLVIVPKGALHAIGKNTPELWRSIAILAALNAQKALRVARDSMIKDPRERLLAVLERLATEIGFDTPIPLTQAQLAELCHLSLRATSKLLNQMAGEGHVVCGYRSINVLKPVKR